MSRLALSMLALCLGVGSAMALVSCGDGGSDEGLLPGDTASEIVANLDTVEELAASGDCASAAATVEQVAAQIDSLPDSVDPQLRNALVDGTQQLVDVVNRPGSCEPATTTETTTTDTETDTDTDITETETTEPEQTTTEPEPTTTQTTTAVPTTTQTQPPTPTVTSETGTGGAGPGSGD